MTEDAAYRTLDPNSAAFPILNLRGSLVGLGPLRRDLVSFYATYMNDFDVTRTLGTPMIPVTFEEQQDWYEKTSVDRTKTLFTIYELSTGRPIGTSGLQNINWMHRRGEFGIAIGVKECWGKGYGTEVAGLLLEYGFMRLNLHHISLNVHSDNERGIRAYRKAGYKEAGRLRESLCFGDKRVDVILMDCLASDYLAAR